MTDDSTGASDGVYSYDPSERLEMVRALMARPNRWEDGRAALRAAFPQAPEEMIVTGTHHLFGDGAEAAVDWLAAMELMMRTPPRDLDGSTTIHLTYHLYNWLQFRSLLPTARQDVLELVRELRQAVDENDMEFVRATVANLEEILDGRQSAPEVEAP